LEGLRVLLAEDNPINQQVACELLAAEGVQLTVANHGGEAIAQIKAQPDGFDVVLMDLQMPEMDGLSATRVLRADMQCTLPIIAMTANTGASDRAACLEAGMNDHIGKPFDLGQLVASLAHWTGRRLPTSPGQMPTPAPELPRSMPPLADDEPPGWASAEALQRLGGQRAVYGRSLARLAEQLPSLQTQLQSRVDGAEAVAERKRLLHSLKGNLGTLGAMAARDALRRAESESEPQASQRALDALTEARAGLLALATRYAEPTLASAEAPGALPDAELRQGLQRLSDLLAQSDAAALDALGVLQPASSDPRFSPLREAVESFAFEEALALSQAWLNALSA
jgi:CheY-like chemotaxis protein/HPt (histidine-containing phosphotransfer) domain-containing protein